MVRSLGSRTPATFDITASNVDVPLEFRLGMREELSQLDAMVLSLDPFSTATELDAIFSGTPPLVGDFDGSGKVDGSDFLLWQRTLGTNTPAVDASGNGVVDLDDLTALRGHFGEPLATPSAAAVPEPAVTSLAGLAAVAGLIVSRRAGAFRPVR